MSNKHNSQPIIDLINLVGIEGNISEHISKVHNHLVHFSINDIDKEMKSSLYFVDEIAKLIRNIEKELQVKN